MHSDGFGDNFSDCNGALVVPGDTSPYAQNLAAEAARAWIAANPAPSGDTIETPGAVPGICTLQSNTELLTTSSKSTNAVVTSIYWFFSGPNAGTVMEFSGAAPYDLCGTGTGSPPIATAAWN